MTATMTEDHVELDARREALERSVLLLCPTIGWWKGQYQLPRGNTEVRSEGSVVDKDDVTTPRTKLMTDAYPVDRHGVAWKKRFQKIESRLSALKDRYSVPFPIQGVRIVPKARGQELMDEMYGLTIGRLRRRIAQAVEDGDEGAADVLQRRLDEALRINGGTAPANTPVFDPTKSEDGQSIAYDLHMAALEFCNDWPAIRNQIQNKNAVFSQVESKVPMNGGVMKTKFALDVVPVELAGRLGDSHTLDQDDLAEHNETVREACRRRVEEAIEEMIRSPRQQLADALQNLKDLIARDGKVTMKSFNPVREAIAKLRMFSFVANDEMMQQINNLEQRLNITVPSSLDSVTAASNGFSAAIEGFMQEVQNAQAQERDMEQFGRDYRGIDLGEE